MEDKNTESTARTAESIPVSETIQETKTEPPKITPEDEKIINSFKNINPTLEELITLVNNMSKFSHELKSMKNITFFLNEENISILKKLNERDNIKTNLILSKIYISLITNESLYSDYLVEITDEKINLIIQIIDECIILIQKLSGFVFDPELFKFKEKTLGLIKCVYWNCKSKISNVAISQKLEGLLDSFPTQFYSETYNELNKEKDLYEILKSQDQEKINTFEDKFAQINNYFEQFEAFKKFVESNAGIVNYATVGETGEEKKAEIKDIDPEKIDFYQQYGMLLLKFCKYHHYIFLNTENKDAQGEKKTEEENEIDNVRVVFLLDKIKYENEENKKEEKKEEEKKEEEVQGSENMIEKTQGNKKIINLMNQKSFSSIVDCKEYNDLIKLEINKFLEITKKYENDPKLKTVIEQMKYFLSILDVESYVPLYLTDFSKITISDNFTPSFLTNVPASKKNELYLETKTNETMLVYIEFSLEDKSKDISFEVNKYEIYSNEYKNIFKEEKIEDTFKFFILCSGYSLYQIIFDNYYSWFTSKDVNYRITLLKLIDKPSKGLELEEKKEENIVNEEIKEEKEEKEEKIVIKEEKPKEKEKDDDNKLYCYFHGKNIAFDKNEICQKIKATKEKKDPNLINIPVIFYLNSFRIIIFNEEKGISFKKYTDEEEDLITKSFFDLKLKHYLSKILKLKQADCKDKKITISIFSQNRELSSLNEDIAEKIKAVKSNSINNSVNDPEFTNYLEKIGFYPGEDIEGYKVEYKLYDLCEQSLIYYLFNSKIENKEIKKSVLFMLFDENVVNAAVFNEGAVFSNFKGKKKYLNNINISDENGVLDFLENANDTFEGIELVLSCIDVKEKDKKKLEDLIEKIKKYCDEKIKVNVTVCDENQIASNVFNYMNLFYED
jgi:hypothetical protein